jgi:hypothetical protein
MSYVPQPPDAEHEWRFDSTRREWFYFANGNQRVYHNSTPRRPPNRANVRGQSGPAQQFHTASNYRVAPGGSNPIAIRPGPTAQPGAGRPITSPNLTQLAPLTGLSPSSQYGRYAVGGASPPLGGHVNPVGSPQSSIQALLEHTASSKVTEGQQKVLDAGK